MTRQTCPTELAATIRSQVPPAQRVARAFDQQAATRGAGGGLPPDVIDIAGVDMVDARSEGLPASPGQYRGRSGGDIHHFEVRVEGGQVQRHILAQISDKPGAQPGHFFFRIVVAGDEQGRHL